MNWLTDTFKSSIGKKAVMAITGPLLGLFVLVHLAGNITSFWGRALFIQYAEHLHSLGFLLTIFEVVLVLIFLLHVALAANLYIENLQSRPQRYAVNQSSGGQTWGSKTMPYTGILIFIFLIVHLIHFQTSKEPTPSADIIRNTLSQTNYAALYIVSVLALALHVSHGFWSMFQSLGWDHPKYTSAIKACALILSILIGTLFSSIPIATLFYPGFLK